MCDIECTCAQAGPSVVYDTQIYPAPYLVSGGAAIYDDSDSDWDLTNGSRILSDSEPPSDSDEESDDDSENKSMVVSKAEIEAKKSKKINTRAVASGRVSDASGGRVSDASGGRVSDASGGRVSDASGGSNWGDVSSGFISYLTKVKLPV